MNQDLKVKVSTLALEIKQHIATGAKIDPTVIDINVEVIEQVISSAFCSGVRNKINVLNHDGELAILTKPEAVKYFPTLFDDVVANHKAIADLCQKAAEKEANEKAGDGQKKRGRPSKNTSMDDVNALLYVYPWQRLIDHVTVFSQAVQLEIKNDPFALRTGLQIIKDKALITYKAEAPAIVGDQDDEVPADFLDHFPYFDELLDWLMAARFCKDRKQCYLWLHCPSNWGKSLLLSVLTESNLAVELNIVDTRKAFNGDPLALTASDFRGQIALVFDEFDRVTPELKLLQNQMYISPKFSTRTAVDLYAKVFLSKEMVHSMTSEMGIEEQLANRMCYIAGKGKVSDRPVFLQKGKASYFSALSYYVTSKLHHAFQDYVAKGELLAQETGQAVSERFYRDHNIALAYGRFAEQLHEHATDWGEWIFRTANGQTGVSTRVFDLINSNLMWDQSRDQYFLKQPLAVFGAYLDAQIPQSQKKAMDNAYTELTEHLSSDGLGVYRRKVNGRTVACIALRASYRDERVLVVEQATQQ